MKKLKNLAALFLMAAVILIGLSIPAAAADSQTPGEITGFAVENGECKVKVSWNASENAEVYNLYYYDPDADSYDRIVSTSKTSYTIKGIEGNKTYYLTVRSGCTVDGKAKYSAYADPIEANPTMKIPAKVTGLKAKAGEHAVTLTWKESENATGYNIYQYEDGAYTLIDSTDKLKYKVEDLAADKEVTFAVEATRTASEYTNAAAKSAKKSATPTSIIPGTVTGVKAEAGDGKVTLSWDKASKATAYIVAEYDAATKTYTTVKATTKCTATIKNLTNGQKYTFAVQGYRTYGTKNTKQKGEFSSRVKATPVMTEVGTPKKLTLQSKSYGVRLEWSSVKYADCYLIYKYDFDAGKYRQLDKVTKTAYKDTSDPDAHYYKYKVIAARKDNGKWYKGTGVEKYDYDKTYAKQVVSSICPMQYSATTRRSTGAYTTRHGSKTALTIPSGTKLTVTYRRNSSRSTVSLNGKSYYVRTRDLRMTSEHYSSSTDYTTEDKEIFVNTKGYKSSTEYLVWVSTYRQRVNLFKKNNGRWELYKTALCGTGKMSTSTPLGNFSIYSHMATHKYSRYSYSYWSKFYKTNAIHQRGKYYGSGAYVNSTLGKTVSHGCVRTTDEMAQYIYKVVPTGTTVVVY